MVTASPHYPAVANPAATNQININELAANPSKNKTAENKTRIIKCNLHWVQGMDCRMVCIVVRMLAQSSSVGLSGIISTKLCSTYQILLPFFVMVFEQP